MSIANNTVEIPVLLDDAAILDATRAYSESVALGSVERDRYRIYPTEELEQFRRTGLLSVPVPRSHGGPGAARSTVIEMFRLLGLADPSIAQILLVHFNILEGQRLGAPNALGDLLFEEALRGARISNAVAERGPRTSSERRAKFEAVPGGGYHLNGTKYYTTGAKGSDWLMVHGTLGDGALAMAFVATEAPGVTIVDDWSGFGQRSSGSGTVVLTDVDVPEERLVAPKPPGPTFSGASGQALHAAIDTGIARAALEDGAEFVRTRSRPWPDSGFERAGDEPHVLLRFGQLTTRLHALEALLAKAGAVIEAAERAPELTTEIAGEVSLAVAEAKAYAADVSLEIATSVIELAGSSATDEEDGLDRRWRDARTHTLHDPARWKYHYIGAHTVNGIYPKPNHLI